MKTERPRRSVAVARRTLPTRGVFWHCSRETVWL